MLGTWETETVDVDACQLFVDVRRGSPKVVVVLHGQLGIRSVFRPFGDAVDEMTVAIPDLRGRGQSVCRDPSQHAWPLLVSDVVAILDHLGVAQAVIAGGSMGAGLATCTALARPERVRALVLWASPYAGAQLGWTAGQRRLMQAVLDMANDVTAHGLDAAIASRARREPSLDAEATRARWQRHDPLSLASALLGLGWHQPFEDLAELSAIEVPVAVAPGNDELHPPGIGEQYLTAIPSAQRTGATPREFAELLKGFS